MSGFPGAALSRATGSLASMAEASSASEQDRTPLGVVHSGKWPPWPGPSVVPKSLGPWGRRLWPHCGERLSQNIRLMGKGFGQL